MQSNLRAQAEIQAQRKKVCDSEGRGSGNMAARRQNNPKPCARG